MASCGPEVSEIQCYLINIGLNAGYILIGIAAVLSILFPIIHIIRNPKQAGTSLLGLGVIAVVFLIGYSLAEANTISYREIVVKGNLSQVIGASIITMYIFVGLAFVSFIFSEIKSLFT